MGQAKRGFSMLVLLMLLVMPSWAQEGTEIAPEPSQEAIVVEVPAPVVEVPPVVAAPDADEVQVNLVQVIIGLLTAFAAGGIIGIAGLAVFVERINKNTSTVTALELLQKSWPPETRELLLGISHGLESIGKLGKEVFDGVPVAEKPVPPA